MTVDRRGFTGSVTIGDDNAAAGGTGWVPVRHLSGSKGTVTVRTAYDTTELATSAGEHLEVITEDIRSGWLWCRSRAGREGWVPLSCEYVFYQAQLRAGRSPNKGALLSSMLEALHEDGQPEESGWPYLPATPTETASWTLPATVGPLFRRAGQRVSPSLQQIVDDPCVVDFRPGLTRIGPDVPARIICPGKRADAQCERHRAQQS